MIAEDVRLQIRAGEKDVTAFEPSEEAFSRIAAHLAAFLNTHGGVVFVGVDSRRRRVGISGDVEAVRRDLEVRLREAILPRALFTVSVDAENARPVITVEAPQGRDGPYMVGRRYHVRRNAETVVAEGELLNEIIRERAVEARRWERRPSLGLDDDDIEVRELRTVMDNAREADRAQFAGADDPMAVLRWLGLTNSGALSHACDVLFARHPERRHTQCRIRYVHYASDKVGDHFIANDWLVGPLGQICDQVFDKFKALIQTRSDFAADDPKRRDKPNYSFGALREGFTNAVAHRDYAGFQGGVTVSVFEHRIEIWNSGSLPKEIKLADLRRVHASIPTNPDICYALYLRGFMDRLGRGTQKIIDGCREAGARAPKWENAPSGVTLTIHASHAPADAEALNLRQIEMMEQLRPGDSIRIDDYIKRSNAPISERQARRDLAELEEAGFLVRIGRARATRYRRTEHSI
jgi:ATP-dependent DNA helicase RecG